MLFNALQIHKQVAEEIIFVYTDDYGGSTFIDLVRRVPKGTSLILRRVTRFPDAFGVVCGFRFCNPDKRTDQNEYFKCPASVKA